MCYIHLLAWDNYILVVKYKTCIYLSHKTYDFISTAFTVSNIKFKRTVYIVLIISPLCRVELPCLPPKRF